MEFSSRRLPHWRPDGKALFISWHLHGSLPHNRYPPPNAHGAGKAFVWMDRQLDQARTGPNWLRREEIARIVVDSLRCAATELKYCELHAFVVMPNHVHTLVTPSVDVSRLLGRTGEQFWQRESYDRWVRDQAEFDKIRRYIEENPVRAGLATRAEDYPWSSAYILRES